MATVSLSAVIQSTTITSVATVSDANANRVLAAEKTYMGTTSNQSTVDALLARFMAEMIADTKTIERNATQPADIPVT